MSAPPSFPSGWFPDPHGRYEHRWFNGTAWTADVADAGERLVDPFGAAPLPRARPGGDSGNRPATVALTCGVIGATLAWMPFAVVVGFALAVVALVFSVRGRRRAALVGTGRGFATAGLITGVLGLGLSVVGVFLTVSVTRTLTDFIDPGPVLTEIDGCDVTPSGLLVRATITNDSATVRDYTVYAVFEQPAGLSDAVLAVDDVAPGETRPIELQRSVATDGPCEVRLVVHGPTPYGVPMERVDD